MCKLHIIVCVKRLYILRMRHFHTLYLWGLVELLTPTQLFDDTSLVEFAFEFLNRALNVLAFFYGYYDHCIHLLFSYSLPIYEIPSWIALFLSLPLDLLLHIRAVCTALEYPEPGSNRHGLLHWCLRPARLPIPPSGLALIESGCKGTAFFSNNQIFLYFFQKKLLLTCNYHVISRSLVFLRSICGEKFQVSRNYMNNGR